MDDEWVSLTKQKIGNVSVNNNRSKGAIFSHGDPRRNICNAYE